MSHIPIIIKHKLQPQKTMISGKAFKALHPGIKFYKLTTSDENHNGYKFQDGINIDTNAINTNKCSKGGIYFTNEENISNWLAYNKKIMKYKREVEILDDSKICIEENKYKTDKMILKSQEEIYYINEKNISNWLIHDRKIMECMREIYMYELE